jgi:hypothetical protein
MSDLPVELDLKFLPDWLKEAPTKNRWADFEGEREGPRRDRDDRMRPEGRGERRGPRRDERDQRGGRGLRPGGRPGKHGDQRGRRDERDFRGQRPRQPFVPQKPAVKVELLPEPAAAAGIAKQIKASSRACGVFRVAKMFLDRAERYRARLTALDPSAVLHQVGDGPVAFDSAAVERGAFRANMDRFYVVEVVQGDAPKGNYTSVARERISGALLGPPNHHSYQVTLRKLYEERYSRRMSFQDFQRNVEIVSDPAAVEQWKQQAGSVTTFKTKVAEGEEPVVLKGEAEAEQHFRATYLPGLKRSGNSLEVSGVVAGAMLDRSVGFAVRDAVDHERKVPVQMVNALRPYFSEAGLHLFKWKRKILYASAIRPQRHPAEQTFSETISGILTTIEEHPGITRPQLAARLLGAPQESALPPAAPPEASVADAPPAETPVVGEPPVAVPDDAARRKEALASDLHYMIQIGYVVEFQNGGLELPQPRKEAAHAEAGDDSRHDIAAEATALDEPAPRAQPQAQTQKPDRREARPGPRRDSRYALLPLLMPATVAALV